MKKIVFATCVLTTALAAACASSDNIPSTPGTTSGGGSSTSSGTSSGGTGSGTTSSSSGGGMTAALPVIVSSDFVPSGYMGDGTTAGSIAMLPQTPTDSTTCNGDRSSATIGTCYQVTYTPVPGGMGWGGVYWQYPSNNWGGMAGLGIAAGATKVSFYAKGDEGGEVVQFVVGGIQAASMSYQDTFKASATETLTTNWTQYEIALPATYGAVLGGFAWAAGAPADAGGPIKFEVDSVEWTM
jgi:hypothetical protein